VTEIRVREDPERPFYTTRSLAQRLSVNEKTVRRLLADGEMPSYTIRDARRIDPADVDAYLASQRSVGRRERN
jgi:excisionase family DNA binding protein